MFGTETEDPDVVPFRFGDFAAGNETRGHRFMAPQPFTVRRLDDYQSKLDKAKVVLDAERRKSIILTEAKQLAFAQGLELVEDQGLLDEVAGLVEWPVVLMGSFDESFLHIPEEVIRATIRNNQKCFVLRDAAHAKLVNKFLLVANVEAVDGGKAIVAGNERVIRARLSDAKFFYETDLKTRLEDRLPKFEHIVFHEKLGSQAERIARIEKLAGELAPLVGADVAKAKRAAKLCKADLLTEVVGEFPELQGLMGKYYAEEQDEDEAVAHACEDHYKPKGPDDLVPSDPVSIAVALADKIDTLVGFWAIDEKPTGSKDPFALRRAALGVIRVILDNAIRCDFGELVPEATPQQLFEPLKAQTGEGEMRRSAICSPSSPTVSKSSSANKVRGTISSTPCSPSKARTIFCSSSAASRRSANSSTPRTARICSPASSAPLTSSASKKRKIRANIPARRMPSSISKTKKKRRSPRRSQRAKTEATRAVEEEDFEAAMRAMAKLRPSVDAFFDKVTVNAEDKAVRENRLKLLNEIRAATRAVADFSRIEG